LAEAALVVRLLAAATVGVLAAEKLRIGVTRSALTAGGLTISPRSADARAPRMRPRRGRCCPSRATPACSSLSRPGRWFAPPERT
jgi:hypothetical protein